MIATLVLAVAQAGPQAVPVVSDPPPGMLWAAYDQCLLAEIDARAVPGQAAEEIFDDSQQACAFWLDAYITKIRNKVIMTNVDFDLEKRKVISAMRDAALPLITKRQLAAKAGGSDD